MGCMPSESRVSKSPDLQRASQQRAWQLWCWLPGSQAGIASLSDGLTVVGILTFNSDGLTVVGDQTMQIYVW